MKNIETERLLLVPVTLEITQSLLKGNYDEIKKLGIESDSMWPTSDTKDILPIINKALELDREPSGFEFWMIVKKDEKIIIGDIGFHGKPNSDGDGEVEIGFGFIEHERGKGYGYESLIGIMDWLTTKELVKVIKAGCLISNNASIRLLEKVGMNEVHRNEEYIFWKKQNDFSVL